jgi:hypothetical protein
MEDSDPTNMDTALCRAHPSRPGVCRHQLLRCILCGNVSGAAPLVLDGSGGGGITAQAISFVELESTSRAGE